MKNISIIIVITLMFTACNKQEFKETKVAPQPTAMPLTADDMANKELPAGHPPIDGQNAQATANSNTVTVAKMEKAANGVTVLECYEKKASLKNKPVTIRGKIVKFSPGIMGKNWIHLRDGSGSEGTNDIVVTTDANAKINDTVIVSGILSTDKDIGSGYFFPVIIENAKIKVE